MSFDLHIAEQISLYLRGQIDVEELESWLAAEAWGLEGNSPSKRVVSDALLLASEGANGDWTDEDLREQLKALLQTIPTSGAASVAGEQLLERLSAAEAEAQRRKERVEALMGYASATPAQASSESWQPSDRGFLRQPTGEIDTQSPVPAELAID